MSVRPPEPREVLGAPVVVFEKLAGHVSGVLLDASGTRPIGLEVTSQRGSRFLPWVAATVEGGAIAAASAFLLFDSCEPYLDQGAILCRESAELGRLLNGQVSEPVVAGTKSE